MAENPEVRTLECEQPVTRAYLESLTTSDLIKMADNSGIDIPSELDRIFIIEGQHFLRPGQRINILGTLQGISK